MRCVLPRTDLAGLSFPTRCPGIHISRQSGGTAIAEVVYGAVNPSGRLPQTIYPRSFAAAVSMLDMGMRPDKRTGNPGRGYRYYAGAPVFGFGEGLSYTKFSCQWWTDAGPKADAAAAAAVTIAPSGRTVRVRVKNIGARPGAHIVFAWLRRRYAAPPGSGQTRRLLVGWRKTLLGPGESAELPPFELRHPSSAGGTLVDGEGDPAPPAELLEPGSAWNLEVGDDAPPRPVRFL